MQQGILVNYKKILVTRLYVALLVTLFLLGACGGDPTVNDDPFVRYRPALKTSAQFQLDNLGVVPRYELDITLDFAASELTGTGDVFVPNTSTDPWSDLYFRLYPSLEQYGGGLTVQNVSVNGRQAPFDYEAESTALRIDLAQPILPGESAQLRFTWKLVYPTWSDNSSIYQLFGTSQGVTSLPLFYPTLAVYQNGPTIGSGKWWLDMGSVRGDAAFNITSLFVVTATVASNLVPVTSGTLVTTTVTAPNRTRHVWVTGPVREFLLQVSEQFSSETVESYGTRVTSYWLPGEEGAGRAALRHTVAALRIYSDLFGEYPYRDLVTAPAPLSYRGMEYPQVSLLGTELYNRSIDKLEMLVAHEVAHQWWYQIVHNDPVNEPWIDEALAEYSMRVYMEKLRGAPDAADLQLTRWQTPLTLLKGKGGDRTVEGPVESFSNANQYETIVYGKGALFFAALRQDLGDRAFFRFLESYLYENRFKIVSAQDWARLVDQLGKPELQALYQEWVGVSQKTAQNAKN